MMNCPACGQVMLTGTRFCGHCGAEVNAGEDHSSAPEPRTILDADPLPYLLISSGPGRGQAFELHGEVYLGRSRANAIAVFDAKVSRTHAKLEPVRDTYILSDLGSANGTFVNGVRISQPVRLRDGDLLQVGDTQLVFHTRPAGPSSAYDEIPAYRPPASIPSAARRSFPLPSGARRHIPTWVWAGCAGLLLVIGILTVVALSLGILIGQGLGGG
jgi:hypothetical protein